MSCHPFDISNPCLWLKYHKQFPVKTHYLNNNTQYNQSLILSMGDSKRLDARRRTAVTEAFEDLPQRGVTEGNLTGSGTDDILMVDQVLIVLLTLLTFVAIKKI